MTLIKQLGYEPGITDMPWLPYLDAILIRNWNVTVTGRPK